MVDEPRKLTEAYADYDSGYAVCRQCNTIYADDMPTGGPLLCPYCKVAYLVRGYTTLEEAKKAVPGI